MGAGHFRADAAGEVVMNQSFRVATFNAENLLHPGVRFAGRPDAPYGEKLYEEKIAWMRGILREGSADMVGSNRSDHGIPVTEIEWRPAPSPIPA